MAAIFDTLENPLFSQAASIEEEEAAAAKAKVAERYCVLNVVNRGSYGVVYRAWDNETGEVVAIKHELDGISQSTAREISILGSLPPHPSVVGFKKAVVDGHRNVLVVMEYLPTDLHRFISERTRMPFTASEVKRMMRQILEGVAFLHGNGVMHRDLKPSNILINNKAELKICDFGLSRHCHAGGSGAYYTAGVVTRWYRAPELLLGARRYSSAIDMWSVGCIMAELVLGQVLFPGHSEIHQMFCIHRNLGQLRTRLGAAARLGGGLVLSGSGIDLLLMMLEVDGEKRITAKDALNHPWFREFYGLNVDH